jgi:hypothetical protein
VEEMDPIFSITTATNNIEITEQRRATVPFTVANRSSHALTGRSVLVMDPPNDSHSDWLGLKSPEESERNFPINGVENYTLEVKVPVEAAAGEYVFHLDMLDIENPDETYTVGPTVKLQVTTPPPPPPKKPFPWRIVAVAVGVLVVIALILFLVSRNRPPDIPASITMDNLERNVDVLSETTFPPTVVLKLVYTANAPGLLANAHDPNGDTLFVSVIQPPSHGQLDIHPDGSFKYVSVCTIPRLGTFRFTETFKIQIDDHRGGQAMSEISFQVICSLIFPP